jgi:hypothetical protein
LNDSLVGYKLDLPAHDMARVNSSFWFCQISATSRCGTLKTRWY